MSRETLPPAVQQLLSRHIRSVEQLEVLLLHSQPARSWSAAHVYEVVRSSPSSVAARLEAFTALGFLTKGDGTPATYRYAAEPTLCSAVDETAHAYQTWRLRVIEAKKARSERSHRGTESPAIAAGGWQISSHFNVR